MTLAVSCVLQCSCSSPVRQDATSQNSAHQSRVLSGSSGRDKATKWEDWLSEDRVESTVRKQELLSRDGQARLDHIRELRALQPQSDILIKLCDEESVQVLRSRVANGLPAGKFPISDLQKYVSPKLGEHSIPLGVVIAPDIFSVREGQPGDLELIRIIDRALQNACVKRRVFEIMENNHFYKIDSATD